MSVRGLPKGRFGTGGGVAIPDFGTVEYIDGGGTTGKSPTVSSMDEDEFTIIVAGASSNSYMYSIGYNESDLACRTICIGHNGSGWESVHGAIIEPYPSTALTHDTSVNLAFGSNDNPAWCRARFRKGLGFRGDLIAAQRYNGGSSTSFAITPFTNPMTNPGGVCIIGAFKDYTAYPDGVSGTGWAKGGNGGLTIQGYYILSTTEIETPGTGTFTSSGGGSHYWAGFCFYLR
jgi:hypothetical protein